MSMFYKILLALIVIATSVEMADAKVKRTLRARLVQLLGEMVLEADRLR
jgi:hypothetical protein